MLNIFVALIYLGIAIGGIFLTLSLIDFGVTIYYIIKRRF